MHPLASVAYGSEPPPTPKLHSQGVVAMDITEQFTHAAQQLELGQLIKDPHFTLFESVGALEIMDRKMDSGYLEPGETMDDEYDYGKPLLPEEIIGIIDQLLCHEMAWHMGYPLSQTIFTSLYIDRIMMPTPLKVEDTYFDRSESCSNDESLQLQVLRAYCLGLVKTCSFINDRVKAEHYYEDEDFVTHTYNRNLLEAIDHTLVIDFLKRTTNRLSTDNTLVPNLKEALICRLDFRTKFLSAVEIANSRTFPTQKGLWLDLLTYVPKLKSSIKLGKPVPSSFSVKIQRKLASTVPPRPIVEVSDAAAFNHLENLCRDASAVVDVLRYHDSQSLMTFVIHFQARQPQPSVYIRTLLQHYLFGDMIFLGTMSIRQILDEDFALTTLPASVLLDRDNDEIEIPTDPRFQIAARMELFRSRAAGSYLDLLRTICQNRCRIRRLLRHNIADWDSLQVDAEELDVELRTYTKEVPAVDKAISDDAIYAFPLSSWVYHFKLRQMEWIVQMGFELEIYQPDELAGMYWYLQYLSNMRSQHIERIRGFILRAHAAYRGKNAEGIGQSQAEFAKATSFLNYSALEAAATYGFANALSSLFTVLDRYSLLYTFPRPYSNAHMRYEVRMKPFVGIGLPELIPFEDLTGVVKQQNESSVDLLKFAAESVAGAKKAFEVLSKLDATEAFCQGSHDRWLKNVKDCLKACIFTGITILNLREAVEKTRKTGQVNIKIEMPKPGKGYHDWWVVPKAVKIS
ncbi:amino-acid N-acetyltransferase-like protein subunit Mak10 [Bisporella sp. PMI_857]|nr:amino-acid N-acetyltransferase-like protein subunit Mak10 [Bisporella sp. PMI_857]